MAYSDVAEMAADDDLRQRLYGCLATLGWPNGLIWVDRWSWRIVAGNPGWANAWASAGASGIQRRGWDPGVITDDMILARVFEVRDEKGDI